LSPAKAKLDRLIWDAVRSSSPLTLCLTNHVTANDCANALLAAGASPVMSLDENDARELAGIASAVVLNIGTADGAQLAAMLGAGRAARRLGKPVVLDPVGAGATAMRLEAARRILDEVGPTVIRGNASEILTLAGAVAGGGQKGVDSVSQAGLEALEGAARRLSESCSAVVAISGPTDVVAEGQKLANVTGGSALMTRITGSGCILSSIVAACAGAAPDRPCQATIAAMALLKEAGSLAEGRLSAPGNLGEFRVRLMDAIAELA
jgi:hydroxyethylthiazole kinase